MILDNEQQKAFLLEMFKQVNFPGQTLDVAYQTKQAVLHAVVMKPPAAAPAVPASALPTMSPEKLAEASN